MWTNRWMAGALVLAVAAACLATAAPASADPVKCKRDIAKAAAKYAQDRSKILAGCEQNKVKGKFTPATNCLTEPATAGKLSAAQTKFTDTVDKSCGGADKTCGAGGDDDSIASIGWTDQCPNFEGGSCNNAISHCGDIADCLSCIIGDAMDQGNDVVHGDFNLPSTGNSVLNKCQAAISKETQKFLATKSKTIQKCWDARLQSKHTAVCPDATIPDTKHAARKAYDAIVKAENKKVAAICKACGGPDKLCDGTGDLSPATIGFAGTCPTVDVPQGQLCGEINVSTLQGLVDCVDCVAEFKVDCADRAAVQGDLPAGSPPGSFSEKVAYPADCNGAYGPTCSQLEVTVATNFTPPGGGDFVAGIGVKLDYNQARLSLPGVGAFDPPTTAARIADLTPTPGDNLITGGDADDSVATVSIADISAPGVEAGNFARITFDCASGIESPAASNFNCVADVGTFNGLTIPGECSVVNVTVIP